VGEYRERELIERISLALVNESEDPIVDRVHRKNLTANNVTTQQPRGHSRLDTQGTGGQDSGHQT
jgi:hypothetical protein